VQTDKERGFKVTYPNKTKENQAKQLKWIEDEAKKREKKLKDEEKQQQVPDEQVPADNP
jgi:hypothetical protein